MPSSNGKSRESAGLPHPAGNGQRPQHTRLDGWKEIADYLGRDIRTCQRWGLKFGLPVHRIDSESNRAKVFAFQSELDEWLKSRDRNTIEIAEKHAIARPPLKTLVIAAVLLAVVAIAGFLGLKAIRNSKQETAVSNLGPVRCALRGKSLAFFDSTDQFLWDWPVDLPEDFQEYDYGSNEFGISAAEFFVSSCVDFADIDGDGRNEAAAFLFDKDPAKRTIALFDDDGKKIIWKNKLSLPYIFPDNPEGHDVYIRSLSFHQLPGRKVPSLCALWNTYRYAPSSFTIFDGKSGDPFFKYNNVGTLRFFKYMNFAGRPYIFLGGTNNLIHRDAVCIVLDPENLQSGLGPPYAAEPDPLPANVLSISSEFLKSSPHASQVQFIRIRRTPLSEALRMQWMSVTKIAVESSQLTLTVGIGAGNSLHYFFDSRFRFESAGSADVTRNFETWRREGKVHGSLEDYLAKSGRDVTFWDGKGWKPLPVEY